MFISITRVSQLRGANSSRYIAAPTPRGMENSEVKPITHSVPSSAGFAPASSGLREGKLVTKSQVTWLTPSLAMVNSSSASAVTPNAVAPMASAANATDETLREIRDRRP